MASSSFSVLLRTGAFSPFSLHTDRTAHTGDHLSRTRSLPGRISSKAATSQTDNVLNELNESVLSTSAFSPIKGLIGHILSLERKAKLLRSCRAALVFAGRQISPSHLILQLSCPGLFPRSRDLGVGRFSSQPKTSAFSKCSESTGIKGRLKHGSARSSRSAW